MAPLMEGRGTRPLSIWQRQAAIQVGRRRWLIFDNLVVARVASQIGAKVVHLFGEPYLATRALRGPEVGRGRVLSVGRRSGSIVTRIDRAC